MWPHRFIRTTRRRSPLMGLVQVVCLTLLPGFAQAQAYPPCPAGTNFMTVSSSDNAATLARSLQCSNGKFIVEWFGDVVVSKTLNTTQGTSLNVTGASTGATADGNHTTQLFAVDGASALHLTDMVLTNGYADCGGAIYAMSHASVSFDGNVTFKANTALYGGAIYADSSTVFWGGEATAFSSNYALYDGGSIMAKGSSSISWDGNTTFLNNSANSTGGAAFLHESSIMSWSGETRFNGNTAGGAGGAVYVLDDSNVCWQGDTTFSYNSAYVGGAVMAGSSSVVSWDGETVFNSNTAIYSGGAVNLLDGSTASWKGNTTFSKNFAYYGGAVRTKAWCDVSWEGDAVFMDNNATDWGGGVFVTDYSNVSWTANTTFLRNSATHGGGLFIYNVSVGNWSGATTFEGNAIVGDGGGLNVHTLSNAFWSGRTTFTGNVANRAGALWIWEANVAWTGSTLFADNIAYRDAGAVYATLTHGILSQGRTTFRNNTAITGNGGALGLYGSLSSGGSVVNISCETTFVNNSAFGSGGAIYSSANPVGQHFEDVEFRSNWARLGGAVATFGTGNGDEFTPSPALFLRCRFISNKATETGGAVETAFGQEAIISSVFESNFAGMMKSQSRQVGYIAPYRGPATIG